MRKLYLITNEFPYGTGEKTFILPELEVLKRDFEITIISRAASSTAKQKLYTTTLDNKIKVFRFCPKEEKIIHYYKFFLLFWIKRDCLKEVKAIIKSHKKVFLRIWKSIHFYAQAECLYWRIRTNNIIDQSDGIYYSYWYNDKVLAMAMHRGEYPNLKIITRAHGYDLFEERVKKTSWQPFKYLMDLSLDKVIFVCEYGLKYYLSKFAMSKNPKYVVQRIGAPAASQVLYDRNPHIFRIVSCSSVIPLKRVFLVINALSTIRDICIEWIHFGDGDDMGNLRDQAMEKLGDKDNITYHLKGWVAREKIYKFYAQNYVNCFITVSSSEGSPVSIQEALAFGIPIIGTDVGGVSEMIDGNGYLLCANPSVEEVANQIEQMAGLNKEEYENMRNISLQIWEKKYNQEKNSNEFLALLKNI